MSGNGIVPVHAPKIRVPGGNSSAGPSSCCTTVKKRAPANLLYAAFNSLLYNSFLSANPG